MWSSFDWDSCVWCGAQRVSKITGISCHLNNIYSVSIGLMGWSEVVSPFLFCSCSTPISNLDHCTKLTLIVKVSVIDFYQLSKRLPDQALQAIFEGLS